MTTLTPARATGAGMMLLALGFNLPYAVLAATFDYPGILREPPEVILAAFAAGGAPLILTWYGFALAALLFIPVALAHGLSHLNRAPALAISAALLGTLAGLTQAMGLLRWVMAVPVIADAGDLALIHAYAGVAIGEHLGMLGTAGFVALSAVLAATDGARLRALFGGLSALAIAIGAFEGVALALGLPGEAFGLAAITGYLMLTAWMIWTGAAHLGRSFAQGRVVHQNVTA